jgi:hypothetical protein
VSQRIWTAPEINEALLVLYLRLNGYFTTGLIVQAPEWGQTRTEIDCVAVRFPNHIQPDRDVEPAPFLELRNDRIDHLICEAKSVPAEAVFNRRIRSEPEVLEKVLQWAGVFEHHEIPRVADRLRPILSSGLEALRSQDGVITGNARVRGLLCCPPAASSDLRKGWCLTGDEILRYANLCFNPPERRNPSSTRYNFNLWGSWLGPVVRYFKDLNGSNPSLHALYQTLGVHPGGAG